MTDLLEGFSLLGLASLAITIVVLVGFTRKLVSFFVPSMKKKEVTAAKQRVVEYEHQVARFYNEIGLYFMPYLYACLLAIPEIQFVYGEADGYAGRAVLGLLVATFSGLFYKSVKKSIPGMFGVEVATSNKLVDLNPEIGAQFRDTRPEGPA